MPAPSPTLREPATDRNLLLPTSGTYLLLAGVIASVLLFASLTPEAELMLLLVAVLAAITGLNYASTHITFTPYEIACTRILDPMFRRSAGTVWLDRLTSVSYYERRDLELILRDSDGSFTAIDVSTPWPRISEWGPLIERAALREGVPLTDEILEILRRGHGRWTWAS